MIRVINLNKKQTKNDFTKSLPSVPGKEFEIKKRLDRLRDIKNPSRKNNNNNNGNYNNNNGGNLFAPGPGDNGSLFPPRLGTGLGLPPPILLLTLMNYNLPLYLTNTSFKIDLIH